MIVRAALPEFESVTVCAALVDVTAWLANVSDAGETLAPGVAAVVPVPARVTACGLPAALSVMVTAADRAPVAVGLNVTLIVQLPLFAATELPQVFVCAKSPLFVPVTPMLDMFNTAFPVLVNVTDCDPLVVFTVWLAKVRLEADKFTAGAVAPPDVRYPGPPRSNVPNDGTPFVKSTSMYHRLLTNALEIGKVFVVVRVAVSMTSPESETWTNRPSRLCCSQPTVLNAAPIFMLANNCGAVPGKPVMSYT